MIDPENFAATTCPMKLSQPSRTNEECIGPKCAAFRWTVQDKETLEIQTHLAGPEEFVRQKTKAENAWQQGEPLKVVAYCGMVPA